MVAEKKPSLETVAIAERLLAQAFGGPVRLGEGRNLGGSDRSAVYRFSVLDGPDDIPASMIVKQVHSTAEAAYAPESADIAAWTFFNEWASLQFLGQIAPGLAPRLYGGDRAAGMIIMEDVGDGKRLDHFLLADDPIAAESALIEYASVHGRLHAFTYGKQDDFYRIRDALGPRKMAGDYYDYAWLAPTLHTTMEALRIAPVPGVEAELAELVAAMLDPGPFLTFMRGDSCPDNCLYTEAGLRLIDFESGKFDHALKEGIYGLIHFPTCWCVYRLPERIPRRMLATYRAELVRGCPAAADDTLFYHAVVAACVFWLLDWYHDVPVSRLMEKDRTLAAASDRQRSLLRSEIVAQLTEEFGHLEAIGVAVRAIAAKMRASWPETESMPYYPAFR